MNGTVIGVDMTLDDNENFSALLQSIREVYTSTVRSDEKKYKKPKFI